MNGSTLIIIIIIIIIILAKQAEYITTNLLQKSCFIKS